jgi:hypothetical protein
MGAPVAKVEAVDNSTAEALLSSLESMAVAERRKHASIFNYWLSIRGDRQFPPIRDLDPLEISDAGPWSVLLEMIGAGENAVIRHLGQAVKLGVEAETIARVPDQSLLACIHTRLPLVATSMQAFAFEDSFETGSGTARCWVTLLPFSASGTWIDYVYGFISLDMGESKAVNAPAADEAQPTDELESFQVPLQPLDDAPEPADEDVPPIDTASDIAEPAAEPEVEVANEEAEAAEQEPEPEAEPVLEVGNEAESQASEQDSDPPAALELESELEPEFEPEPDGNPPLEAEPALGSISDLEDSAPPSKAGFSAKFLESLAHVGGFYGRVVHAAPGDPIEEPVSDEFNDPAEESVYFSDPGEEAFSEESGDPVEVPVPDKVAEPNCGAEGTLQSKLSDVRAMAEEAREAQLRSNQALYAGLSAAYDFALDAEAEPEEYLRLVEGQGLKIQLRSPMKPVVKLAFAETCDEDTISQLEAVLAWALKMDLPRGSRAERIEAEGGLGPILEGLRKAA